MKLWFLIFHCRKNSVKDKVISKKWIYLERNILHRVWAISEGKRASKYDVVSFYVLSNFIGERVGGFFQLF